MKVNEISHHINIDFRIIGGPLTNFMSLYGLSVHSLTSHIAFQILQHNRMASL